MLIGEKTGSNDGSLLLATAIDPETAEKATGITSLGFVKEQSADPKGPRMIVRPKVAEGGYSSYSLLLPQLGYV